MPTAPAPSWTVFAHRGDHRSVPENTAAAFAAAWDAGFRAVELDLQSLADGTIVVFHDDDTARLAPQAAPVALAQSTLAQLRTAFPALQTFDEFVADFAPRNWVVNLEIKDNTRTLRRAAHHFPAFRHLVISSFDVATASAARADGWPNAWLFDDDGAWRAHGADLPDDARVHVSLLLLLLYRDAPPPLWRRNGVYVYTVNDVGLARQLRDLGWVRGVFTDDAAVLVA